MKQKKQKEKPIMPTKKPRDDADLIQRYHDTTHPQGKKMLLGLIRLKHPDFKE